MKWTFVFQLIAILVLSILGLTACTNQVHQWNAKPVLAVVYSGPGYIGYERAWGFMPGLVLYADGRMILTHYDSHISSIQEAHLSTQEFCALLEHIESNGFFDIKMADYHKPGVTDMGMTNIVVDTWRSKKVSAYALDYAIKSYWGFGKFVNVPPALTDTYQFLTQYTPKNTVPYLPDRIGLLIEQNQTFDNYEGIQPWPLMKPMIKDLAPNLKTNRVEIVLEGQEAARVLALFSDDWEKPYKEDGVPYLLAVRPLLPLEIWNKLYDLVKYPQFEEQPQTELTCGQP